MKSENEDSKGGQDKSHYITETRPGTEDKVPLCGEENSETRNTLKLTAVLNIRLEADTPSVRQMSDRDKSTADTV